MKVLLVSHDFLPRHAMGTEIYTLQLGKELRSGTPTREALAEVFGLTPLAFEAQWREWVLATYPTR